MAVIKVSVLFQLATNVSSPTEPLRRIGGWSEGFYDDDTPDNTRAQVENFCKFRAALLPKGASIIGQRYQQIGSTAPAQTVGKIFPGKATQSADIPQMALQLTCAGEGVINTRKYVLAGIPDEMVKEGEYSPTANFRAAMAKFLGELKGFRFRARDKSVEVKPLIDIGTGGVLVFDANHGYIAGDTVTVSGVKCESGFCSWKGKVATVPTPTTLTLSPAWPWGEGTGGKVQKVGYFYPVIAAGISVDRVKVRKIGRPSAGYRGRRSKRRRLPTA